MNAKLKFYQKDAIKTRLAGASPYQVIQMLMTGVSDSLVIAKSSLQRKDFELKAKSLSKASNILEALRSCLDESFAPELVENLYALYSYMIDRLADASIETENTDAIDEVARLFHEIKSAWDEIPYSAQQEAESKGIVAHASVG